MDVKFSSEAQWLIRSLKEFDAKDCIEWYIKNQLVIGSHGILEYLKYKDNQKIKENNNGK
jgi:hypothetical protein